MKHPIQFITLQENLGNHGALNEYTQHTGSAVALEQLGVGTASLLLTVSTASAQAVPVLLVSGRGRCIRGGRIHGRPGSEGPVAQTRETTVRPVVGGAVREHSR